MTGCTTCAGDGRLKKPVAGRPPGYDHLPESYFATITIDVPCPDCQEPEMNEKITPVEPSSEQRQAALLLRGWYVALLAAGFTDDEALRIIGSQLGGN